MNQYSLSAYVMAAIFAGVFLLLACLKANMIQYEGGINPKDPKRRKTWFWIFGIAAPLAHLLYGFIMVRPDIKNLMFRANYTTSLFLSTVLCLGIYVLGGFIISKSFPKSKVVHFFK